MDKKELRTFLLQYRDKMDKMDAAAHSRSICQELKSCFRGDRVMVYLATGNECDPEEYYEDLLHSHSSVYVPVCTDKGWMEASRILDPEADLEIGTFGIRAPKASAYRFADPEILDVVIVPGVGFDRKGNRLGFGGGFYDRFLPRTRLECLKVAICHDFQLVDDVYPEPHDFPMDYIVTEKGIYKVKGRK